jgi:hypothetical protein
MECSRKRVWDESMHLGLSQHITQTEECSLRTRWCETEFISQKSECECCQRWIHRIQANFAVVRHTLLQDMFHSIDWVSYQLVSSLTYTDFCSYFLRLSFVNFIPLKFRLLIILSSSTIHIFSYHLQPLLWVVMPEITMFRVRNTAENDEFLRGFPQVLQAEFVITL